MTTNQRLDYGLGLTILLALCSEACHRLSSCSSGWLPASSTGQNRLALHDHPRRVVYSPVSNPDTRFSVRAKTITQVVSHTRRIAPQPPESVVTCVSVQTASHLAHTQESSTSTIDTRMFDKVPPGRGAWSSALSPFQHMDSSGNSLSVSPPSKASSSQKDSAQ